MTPMEFTVAQLQIATVHIHANASRSNLTADKIKGRILELIVISPRTSEDIAEIMGFGKSQAKHYLRSLVLDGEIEAHLGAHNKPATYMVAELEGA